MRSTIYLNPTRKLVDEVADWLCGVGSYVGAGRVRQTPEGAYSLGHVMVVVPTSQSGRNLRLALAERFEGRGLIPPRVVLPRQIVVSADDTRRDATAVEVAATFQKFIESLRHEIMGIGRDGAACPRKFSHLFRVESFDDLTARFALLDQLVDIWKILAGDGLLMREVRTRAAHTFEQALGDEAVRWDELGELESRYFDFLHERGLRYPTENIHDARQNPRQLETDIEEVVLPALADPIRVLASVLSKQRDSLKLTVLLHATEKDAADFDVWGRPITSKWIGRLKGVSNPLADADIIRAANGKDLAWELAQNFPAADAAVAWPALALCDESLYTDVAAAFLARSYGVHNPEKHSLAVSSLGHLVNDLLMFYKTSEKGYAWRDCVAVIRNDDLLTALGYTGITRAAVLKGIDIYAQTFLPQIVTRELSGDKERLWSEDAKCVEMLRAAVSRFFDWVESSRRRAGVAGYLRAMLGYVYAERTIDAKSPEAREFAIAMSAVSQVLNDLESDAVTALDLTTDEMLALARRTLASAYYTLEPETVEAFKTEGWLELSWSRADNMALVGFHEGSVPDSVVGHPFVPDALRAELGLVTNEARLARDTWIFYEILSSHAPHAIKAFVARTDARGDICRPSRLLYDTKDLAARVAYLYGDVPTRRMNTSGEGKTGWTIHLPDVETLRLPAHFSASAIDRYLQCPFTYFLQNILGMESIREKFELDACDFGTLEHWALERYAQGQIARGDNQLTHREDIEAELKKSVFPFLRTRYGNEPSLDVRLQLEALEGRLGVFAAQQAEWAEAGWRIEAAELSVNGTRPLKDQGVEVEIHGSIDRVDRNIKTGQYRLIDYKTWDDKDKAREHVYAFVKSPIVKAFVERMGYPIVPPTKTKQGVEKNDAKRILSIQLYLYAQALMCLDAKYQNKIESLTYLVLGSTPETSGTYELKIKEELPLALKTAARAVNLIRARVFWPPSPARVWKYEFSPLFRKSPEEDLSEDAWCQDQARRLSAVAKGGEND